jgi:hypothetical protein
MERNGFVIQPPPNNSFNPTLASEPFIIKFGGSCYLACGALASGGLIRALAVWARGQDHKRKQSR